MGSKRLRDDNVRADEWFPQWFSIPGLGGLVVYFLPLGQWSEWLWQLQYANEVDFVRALSWRPELDAYGFNRCVFANNYNLLKHMHRLQHSDIARIRANSDLIRDLISRPEDVVYFLIQRVDLSVVHEAFYVCCSLVIVTSYNSLLVWRLPLLLSCVGNDVVERGFMNACTGNNLVIAQYLWSTGRVANHKDVFEQLSLTVNKTMLEFLLGLGFDSRDTAHLRAKLLTEVPMMKMVENTDVFPLLERINVIRSQDCQHYFEVAYSCNNVQCMRYFYSRYATFQYPVKFNLQDGIWHSECLDILLMHKQLDIHDASYVIRKIRSDIFDRAKDVVLHTLKTHVMPENASRFWHSITRAAWRARNVPLLSWLWANYSDQTIHVFGTCFTDALQYSNNAQMLQFVLKHCNHTTITNDQKTGHVIRAIRRKDINMFKLLLQYGLVSEQDIFHNNLLKSSLRELCVMNVEFLKLMWKPTEVWENEHNTLLKQALNLEVEQTVSFLLSKKNHIPKSMVIEYAGFFVHFGMYQVLDILSPEDISSDVRDDLEHWCYASISNKNTIATLEVLWRILPPSREQLLADDCELFWRICQKNLLAGVLLWRKQLLTSADILKAPPLFPQTVHNFLAVIHFDV